MLPVTDGAGAAVECALEKARLLHAGAFCLGGWEAGFEGGDHRRGRIYAGDVPSGRLFPSFISRSQKCPLLNRLLGLEEADLHPAIAALLRLFGGRFIARPGGPEGS